MALTDFSAWGRLRLITREQWVLDAYAVLLLVPLAWYAITWGSFWHSMAPFTTLLVIAVLWALVRRQRWAWRLLIVIEALALLSYVGDPAEDPEAVGVGVVRLALLLSPAMQRYLDGRSRSGLVAESQ